MLTFTTKDNLAISNDQNNRFTFKINSLLQISKNIICSFQIPKAGLVELGIFNLAGQEVKTFHRTCNTAGNYTVRWSKGTPGAGMYLYRLTSGSQVVTRKFVCLK
jgi:hypothetical protein